jgi:hypothetical protein
VRFIYLITLKWVELDFRFLAPFISINMVAIVVVIRVGQKRVEVGSVGVAGNESSSSSVVLCPNELKEGGCKDKKGNCPYLHF